MSCPVQSLALVRFERSLCGRPGGKIGVGIDVQKFVKIANHDRGGHAANIFADIGSHESQPFDVDRLCIGDRRAFFKLALEELGNLVCPRTRRKAKERHGCECAQK